MRGETAPRATCYGGCIMADPLKPIRSGAAGVVLPPGCGHTLAGVDHVAGPLDVTVTFKAPPTEAPANFTQTRPRPRAR